MTQLPSTHPEVYQMLCQKGSWTLQRCDRVPFSSVAADQAIEQTVNRDTKTAGGLKGVTLKRGMFYFKYTDMLVLLMPIELLMFIHLKKRTFLFSLGHLAAYL